LESEVEGGGELVAAGCGFVAALNPFEFADTLFNVHTLDKYAKGLQVAVATAFILNIVNFAVPHIKTDCDRTDATRLKFIHIIILQANFFLQAACCKNTKT
jgi:hypothetical protein